MQYICFSAGELKDLSVDSESRAGINWQGYVTWVLYHKFETRCPVDLTFLPFDSQICTIEVFNNLMSGLGQIPKVVFHTIDNIETSLFKTNAGWTLTKHMVSGIWCDFVDLVDHDCLPM